MVLFFTSNTYQNKMKTPSHTMLMLLGLTAVLLTVAGCGNNSRREEISRRRAALTEKQDSALRQAQQQLAEYDSLLQQTERSYDSLQTVVERHRAQLTATEDELRQLNLMRQHRDSLRTQCEVLGAKIRYIHRRQEQLQQHLSGQ